MDGKEIVQHKPSFLLVAVVMSSLLGSLSIGLVCGYTSSAIPSMECNHTLPVIVHHEDEETKSWIKSIVSIGAIVGALSASPIANSYGRKMPLIFTNGVQLLGWLSIAMAPGVLTIIFGRLLNGVCCGLIGAILPLYLSEISPSQLRGFIGSSYQTACIGGILLSAVFGIFFEWRELAYISAMPSILMPILMLFAPESPAFLINSKSSESSSDDGDSSEPKNSKKTYKALARLRSSTSDIQAELNEMSANASTSEPKVILPWSEMKKPTIYKPFWITMGLMFFMQFSGVSPVVFSMVEIFEVAHISLDPFVCAAIVNGVSFTTTIVSSLIVDKLGRKPLLLVSGVLHVISLLMLGTVFYFIDLDPDLGPKYGFIALIALIIFIMGYQLGYGPLPWTMVSEYTVYEARGLVSSAGVIFAWGFAFLLIKSFEDILIHYLDSHGTYWLLAFISFFSLPFVAFFVPETKGKSCEETAKKFEEKLFLDVPCTSGDD